MWKVLMVCALNNTTLNISKCQMIQLINQIERLSSKLFTFKTIFIRNNFQLHLNFYSSSCQRGKLYFCRKYTSLNLLNSGHTGWWIISVSVTGYKCSPVPFLNRNNRDRNKLSEQTWLDQCIGRLSEVRRRNWLCLVLANKQYPRCDRVQCLEAFDLEAFSQNH